MSDNLNEFTIQQEDNFKIKEIFFKVIKAWKLLVFLLVVFLSWAYFQVRYSIPIYESVISIVIKNDVKSNSGLTETSAFEDIELFQVGNSMENEKAVLVSRTIIGQVVDSLDLQKSYFSVAGIVGLTKRELYNFSAVFCNATGPACINTSPEIISMGFVQKSAVIPITSMPVPSIPLATQFLS
jgi:hypothetical protein